MASRLAVVVLTVSMLTASCGGGGPDYPLTSPGSAAANGLIGFVRTDTGAPLSQGTVSIVSGANVGRSASINQDTGAYRIDNLSTGTSLVRAAISGYVTADKSVSISGNTTLDFTLLASGP
jgi:hypothetical protein